MLRALTPLCVLAVSGLLACGDDGGTGGGGPGGGGGSASVERCDLPSPSSSSTGGAAPFVPTPEQVQFAAVAPLLDGEQILVNDWNAAPNEVLTMRPDGSGLAVVFRAFRVWSMGVSSDASTIAFAAGDPDQVANYGITIGDAIQPTFLYDVASQTAEVLSFGNLNDECHSFGHGDAYLYVCRRYDFDAQGMPKGYRIGRIDLTDGRFEWITDESSSLLTLSPQPTATGCELVYSNVPVPTGARTIVRRAIAGGAETILRDDAGFPTLSPDGTSLLVADYTRQGSLVLVREGQPDVLVVQGPDLSNARFSPDGTRVAFLRWDDAGPCSHVEIASIDGSQATAPTRIHDCVESGRFISDLAWVVR